MGAMIFTLYGNENVSLINSMLIYDRWGNLVERKVDFNHSVLEFFLKPRLVTTKTTS